MPLLWRAHDRRHIAHSSLDSGLSDVDLAIVVDRIDQRETVLAGLAQQRRGRWIPSPVI
jgi:ABC-type proline/glycine betaine transport system permease subunit